MTITDRFVEELAGAVSTGGVVLFTGAGFARDARSLDGDLLPSSEDLLDLMWPIAFDGVERDRSELTDVYACAVKADPERTGRLLQHYLCVDERSLPPCYETWFSMPWFRIYTLNVDDLEQAVARRFDLPTGIRAVSALSDELPPRSPQVLCVHLNGSIADYPNLTFSQQQYGQRTARPDPWYQHLATDLSTHTVLFVGTMLNEPPLWQQYALRLGQLRPNHDRPRSFLVSPRVPLARSRVLEHLNVEWIQMEQAEFAEKVLSRLGDAAAAGHRALAESASAGG